MGTMTNLSGENVPFYRKQGNVDFISQRRRVRIDNFRNNSKQFKNLIG